MISQNNPHVNNSRQYPTTRHHHHSRLPSESNQPIIMDSWLMTWIQISREFTDIVIVDASGSSGAFNRSNTGANDVSMDSMSSAVTMTAPQSGQTIPADALISLISPNGSPTNPHASHFGLILNDANEKPFAIFLPPFIIHDITD
jgi:hypothetical protein